MGLQLPQYTTATPSTVTAQGPVVDSMYKPVGLHPKVDWNT